MVDALAESNRFFDHSASAVDAIAGALVAGGTPPSDFVIFVIDASKGKGKTLSEMLAEDQGTTHDEKFRHLPTHEDPTLVRALPRGAAAKLVATWNPKIADLVQAAPAEGHYWVVVIAAGATRALDRRPPTRVGQA